MNTERGCEEKVLYKCINLSFLSVNIYKLIIRGCIHAAMQKHKTDSEIKFFLKKKNQIYNFIRMNCTCLQVVELLSIL